jgi:hypothetical protein
MWPAVLFEHWTTMNIPSVKEFGRMNRADRLLALRQAQELHGIDASEYRRLASVHAYLLRSGQLED